MPMSSTKCMLQAKCKALASNQACHHLLNKVSYPIKKEIFFVGTFLHIFKGLWKDLTLDILATATLSTQEKLNGEGGQVLAKPMVYACSHNASFVLSFPRL